MMTTKLSISMMFSKVRAHTRNCAKRTVLVVALLLFCVPASAQSYTIIDLGTLGGDRSFVTIPQAAGINNRGQVAGSSFTAGDAAEHAFLNSNGSMMDLGTFLGGNISRAFGVNNAGQVVGFSSGAGFQTHAFLYSNGSMMDLGALGGRKSAIAWAINDAGQITGGSGVDPAVPVEYFHAFLYTNGSMMDLGTLGGPESQGYAINNRGQVTGFSFMASNALTYHAFLSINGSMMDLGTLGGTKSQGFGINNAGQVVGSSLTADDVAE